jgi:ferredoxin
VGTFLFALYLAYYTPVYVYGMSGHGLVEYFPVSVASSLAALGIGVLLFGRRLQCTVVCMVGHMSLNSFYSRFRARSYGLTKLSADHGVGMFIVNVVTIASAAAFPAVLISYFMGISGPEDFTWLDIYGMGIVNIIWFMFYFITPITGSYSCSRYGYCGFGTIMGVLGNKLGLFRLRVRDINTCIRCATRDCEKACPPGVPLWVDFVRSGSSRNIRCVGYGECVAACPYSNLTMEDITRRIRIRNYT